LGYLLTRGIIYLYKKEEKRKLKRSKELALDEPKTKPKTNKESVNQIRGGDDLVPEISVSKIIQKCTTNTTVYVVIHEKLKERIRHLLKLKNNQPILITAKVLMASLMSFQKTPILLNLPLLGISLRYTCTISAWLAWLLPMRSLFLGIAIAIFQNQDQRNQQIYVLPDSKSSAQQIVYADIDHGERSFLSMFQKQRFVNLNTLDKNEGIFLVKEPKTEGRLYARYKLSKPIKSKIYGLKDLKKFDSIKEKEIIEDTVKKK
jgi:hypothetical protein